MVSCDNWSGRNSEKDALRNLVWAKLANSRVAVGKPFQNIPDFIGSDQAADLLSKQKEWETAQYLMVSPDVPQIAVRKRAIMSGMTVYMAVPQLREGKCFIELNLNILEKYKMSLEEAATWQGAVKLGTYIDIEQMHSLDLSITGCVAVTTEGGRTGKGGGFADLEHALMRRYNKIKATTPIITTVHPLQIVDREKLPLQPHDTRLSMIVTPDEVIRIPFSDKQPLIDWDMIQDDQWEKIPILKKLYLEDKCQEANDGSHR